MTIESDNFHKTLMKYKKSYISIPKIKLYTNRSFNLFYFIHFFIFKFLPKKIPPTKKNYLNLHYNFFLQFFVFFGRE